MKSLHLLCVFTMLMITYSTQAQEVDLLPEGIVFPKLTENDRDQLNAIEGQCIYNLDKNQINLYDGNNWIVLGGTTGSWTIGADGIYYNSTNKNVAIGSTSDSDNKLYVNGDARISDSLRIGSPGTIIFEDQIGNPTNNRYSGAVELFDGGITSGVELTPERKISLKARGTINTDPNPEFRLWDRNEKESYRLDYNDGIIYQAMYSDSANIRLRFSPGPDDDGPFIEQLNSLNNKTFEIKSTGSEKSATLLMNSELGNLRIGMFAKADELGSKIELFNSLNVETVQIDAQGSGHASFIELRDSLGNVAIKLDADHSGDSRITVDEIELLGGSDFAEQFDLAFTGAIEPGLLVSIHPNQDGKLMVSQTAYDQKIVGVISGANGVSPGIVMREKGSIADGEYPIALLGRVYVKADASQGKINAGDLLTSSNKPGHVMKAKKMRKSHGAIIGKAMSSIDKNGFVLVLINLQ